MKQAGLLFAALALVVAAVLILGDRADESDEQPTAARNAEGKSDLERSRTRTEGQESRTEAPKLSDAEEQALRLAKERRKVEFLTRKLEELAEDERELLEMEGAEAGLETLRGHQERLRRDLAASEARVENLEAE